jgi:hypothetical protein
VSDLRFTQCDSCGQRSPSGSCSGPSGGYSDKPLGWIVMHFTVAPESPYISGAKSYGHADFCTPACVSDWVRDKLPKAIATEGPFA